MYTINSDDGKQYIYSLQLGCHIRSRIGFAFAGGPMNYFQENYDGYLDAKLKKDFGWNRLDEFIFDCDQTGWGLTPVWGLMLNTVNSISGLNMSLRRT